MCLTHPSISRAIEECDGANDFQKSFDGIYPSTTCLAVWRPMGNKLLIYESAGVYV
jgi:hypothetical protein